MMYLKYSLSLRNVEDLLHERGIDICHETPRLPVNPALQDRIPAAAARNGRQA
jgi:transposase-like protein